MSADVQTARSTPASPSAPAAPTEREQILLVAEREFVEYARQPSYRNGTLISIVMLVAAVAAASILPALFGGPDELRVGVLPGGEAVAEALAATADPEAVTVETVPLEDRATADAHLRDETLEVVVIDDATIVVHDDLDPELGARLQTAADTAMLAGALGAPPAEALAATRVTLEVEMLEPPDPTATQRRVITLVGVLLAFGQVFGGAFVIANGLVEEKSSRVVELIVAKAPPRILLAGKLVGLGAVLTLQLLIFVVVGLAAVAISPDLSVPPELFAAAGSILLWYLLAFVIFGALFSIAGALSARQEDMAMKVQPMMYLGFAAFGAAFYASVNPDSVVSVIATFVPFTAPVVIPARQVAGAIAGWEIAVAVLLTLVTAWVSVRVAGRVYSGGALRTRGSATVRAAWRGEGAG